MSAGLIDAIEGLLAETADADEVLRRTVEALVAEPEIAWAGVAFVEGNTITLGPAAGTPDESRRTRVPIASRTPSSASCGWTETSTAPHSSASPRSSHRTC